MQKNNNGAGRWGTDIVDLMKYENTVREQTLMNCYENCQSVECLICDYMNQK